MAKLFKTISLEERYNSSIHNGLPVKAKAVNQGSIALQPAKPSKELESALLKTLPNAVEQNSAILKGMIKGPASIPPFVNTKFRSAISLADRLTQPKIGSTAHLAQYFLSDVYTDFIKITPFGIFNHTSTTVIQPVKADIAQGGQNPVVFNPMVNQGLVYANGFASSVINVSVPTYDSLLLQGTFFSNGVYSSFTTTTSPLGVNQGSGTNPVLAVTAPFLAPLQGPGTNPITVITNAAILATQGTILSNNGIKSITNIVLPRSVLQSDNVILGTPIGAVMQDGNIILDVPIATVVQSIDIVLGTPSIEKKYPTPELKQITFEPKYTFPVLKSLRYAADRALAAFSPTVKHGSSGIPTSVTKQGSTYFQDAGILFGDYYSGGDVRRVASMSRLLRTDPNAPGNNAKNSLQGLDYYISRLTFEPLNQNETWRYNDVGTYTKQPVELDIQLKKVAQDLDPNQNASLGHYDTLLYKDLVARSNTSVKGKNGTDFRSLLQQDGIVIKYIDNSPTDRYLNKKGSVEERSPLGESKANGKSDFVNLSIKSLGSNNAIAFRSYITSFSDSWTNTWEDTKLLNRLETLHSYRGVVRGGSIAFKVPALSKKDMGIIYGKLQNLIRITSIPKAPTTTGTMMKAPICSFTLGKWYINTPIAVNSVKYDIQMADYAWDIDEQRPQIVDVSMDFKFIVGIDDTTSVPTAGLIPFA